MSEQLLGIMLQGENSSFLLGVSFKYAVTSSSASFLSFQILGSDSTCSGRVVNAKGSRSTVFFFNHLYIENSEDIRVNNGCKAQRKGPTLVVKPI